MYQLRYIISAVDRVLNGHLTHKNGGVTVVVGWMCTSAAIVQGEAKNETSLSERRYITRSYRRPHVERVWIVRPVDSINHNFRAIDNFTDPVRSFAVAIRDPETFLRYLRHEESQRLGKQTRTSYNQMLPSPRHVQMQILSLSDSKEKSPVLNIVMEQDDKMNVSSFMDLMEQVSSLPAYNKQRSEYNYEDKSISELEKQQKAMWAQRYALRQHRQDGTSHHKQRPAERNTNPDGRSDVKANESELETERSWKQPSVRKTDRKHRERHYRQRDGVVEPMLIVGDFGKRNPNYSRPSTRPFNRPQSQDISVAPSPYLLPPVFSTFRRSDLLQDLPSSSETPVTTPDGTSALRKLKERPISHNSRRPVGVFSPSTDIPQSSNHTALVYNETSPLAANRSLVSADIPRASTDIPRQPLPNDISHVHISIPRIYTSVSRPDTDVSAPPFTDISRVHIAISRQPLNPSSSSTSSRLTNKEGVEDFSPPNASELSSETTSTPYEPTEATQPGDSFRLNVNILPPSLHILPPLLTTLTENQPTNEQSGVPAESEDDEEFYVDDDPTYSSYQNEASGDSGAASSPQEPSHPVARNTKTMQTDRAVSGDTQRESVSGHSDYGELQLTAAETAYYRRRQLRKPPVILEITGESLRLWYIL